jgi:hypothetical protein
MSKSSTKETKARPQTSSLGWNVDIGNPSVAMCAPSYSIQPLNVTIDVSGTNSAAQIRTTKPATRTTKQLDGFSTSDFNSLLETQFYFVSNHVPSSPYYSSQLLILSLQNGNTPMDPFLDPETLRDAVSNALEGDDRRGIPKIQDCHVGEPYDMQPRITLETFSLDLPNLLIVSKTHSVRFGRCIRLVIPS